MLRLDDSFMKLLLSLGTVDHSFSQKAKMNGQPTLEKNSKKLRPRALGGRASSRRKQINPVVLRVRSSYLKMPMRFLEMPLAG